MSINGTETLRHASPSFSFGETNVATIFQTWMRRARQRRDLASLTDFERADIGLSDDQIAREAARPFWRA